MYHQTSFPIHKDEEGSVMFAVIMILVLATLISIAAMNTTDIELQIATNDRLYKTVFYVTDSAPQVVGRLIEGHYYEEIYGDDLADTYDAAKFTFETYDTNGEPDDFHQEAIGAERDRSTATGVTYIIQDQQIFTDLNMRHVKPAAGWSGGAMEYYYDLATTGTGLRNAESQIDTVFRIFEMGTGT